VQPFVYRKAAAGEEFEERGRHRPARRDRTFTAKGRKSGDIVADSSGTLPRSSVAIRKLFKSLSFSAYSRVQRDTLNYHNYPKRNGFKPNRKAGD
jgi:hypothetical protein